VDSVLKGGYPFQRVLTLGVKVKVDIVDNVDSVSKGGYPFQRVLTLGVKIKS
jgi:hypothetical protein